MDNEKTPKKPSKLQSLRGNHKARLWLIGILMLIVAVLFVFFEKLRIFLVIAFITLLTAFGLEVSQNDWDLGTLWQTKSFEESKIMRDVSGNVLFDRYGEITTNATEGKAADAYNCSDFDSQLDAQKFFVKVGGVNHDLNKLDGDKDGEACESLPKGEE